MKLVVPRGQPGVERLPARACVLPFGIDIIQLVAKHHAFGNGQAQRGVVDLKPFRVCRKCKVA